MKFNWTKGKFSTLETKVVKDEYGFGDYYIIQGEPGKKDDWYIGSTDFQKPSYKGSQGLKRWLYTKNGQIDRDVKDKKENYRKKSEIKKIYQKLYEASKQLENMKTASSMRIAEELVKIAEDLVFADSDYIYDPDHKKHPSGGYHKTEKGWSKVETKKQDSNSSKLDFGMNDEQKELDEIANENSKNDKKRIDVAKNLKTHPKTLHTLATIGTPEVQAAVAANPNTKPFTLDKLSYAQGYKSFEIRYAVSWNKNTSSETLDRLSKDEEDEIRMSVADNENTSTETLDRLSNDKRLEVRHKAASHKNISPEALDKLSNDEEWYVRKSAAGNPKNTPEALEKLSHDESNGTRFLVSMNPSTSVDTLRNLSNDKDGWVQYGIASNKNTPSDILQKQSKSKDEIVRRKVAENPNTPDKVLEKLSKDKDEDVSLSANKSIEKRKQINKSKEKATFDVSKLSPQLREVVQKWDQEDIKKFLGWLRSKKGKTPVPKDDEEI